jgi:hypothetical protein
MRDDTALIDTLRYLPATRMPYDVVLKAVRSTTEQGRCFSCVLHGPSERSIRSG